MMTTMTRKRLSLRIPAVLTATLLLASCSGTEEASTPPEFNDADVVFAQSMIPHHEQAVEMSLLADDRAGDEVRELADEIEAAQGPEIERLNGMLESWGEEPAGDTDGTGQEGMAGMMTGEEMAELTEAEGDAFDAMFLDMMIVHHEGAIDMAQDQLDDGSNAEATELARAVMDAQESEIEQMTGMLDGEGTE